MLTKILKRIVSVLPFWLGRSIIKVYRLLKYGTNNKGYIKLNSYKPYYKHIRIYNDIAFKIKLDPRNGYVDDHIHKDSIWEKYITKLMLSKINKDTIFIDVGANIGYESLLAAAIGAKQVYSFEPISRLYNQILDSVQINGFKNIEVFNYACSDKKGTLRLNISGNNIGGSSFVYGVDTITSIDVPVITLDAFLLPKLDYCDSCNYFMKIDVEGFEPNVISGSIKFIKKHKPTIILEFSPKLYELQESGKTFSFLMQLFSLGYELNDIRNNIFIKNDKSFIKKYVKRLYVFGDQSDLLCINRAK